MNFLKLLFSQPPEPQIVPQHDLLGNMAFDQEDETWYANLNGITIGIPYTYQAEPSSRLIEYAISLVEDKIWLLTEIEKQAQQYVTKYPEYRDEVLGLSLSKMYVSEYKDYNIAFIEFEGGYDYRAWRIEFKDRTCLEIGFDS